MSKTTSSLSITILLNGKRQEIPGGLTLASLLEHLHVKRDRVAIERNREIVSATLWDSTVVGDGDELEVVHFVGGGSADTIRSGAFPRF